MKFFLATAILLASAMPAFGQSLCGNYSNVVARLAEKFGEHLVSGGMATTADKSLRIFASPRGETWTALEISRFADGQKWACLVRSGKFWRRKPLPEGPVS